jgi:hypothetical protein
MVNFYLHNIIFQLKALDEREFTLILEKKFRKLQMELLILA